MKESIELNFKKLFHFLGKKTFFWLVVSFFSSIFLGFIELLIALFIQLFLKSLGFLSAELKIFGYVLPDISTIQVILFLLTIGFIRFLGNFTSLTANSLGLEHLSCRLKTIASYDLLYNSSKKLNTSGDINFHLNSLYPGTLNCVTASFSFMSSMIQSISVLIIMFFTAINESILSFLGLGIIAIFVKLLNKKIKLISKTIPLEQAKFNANIEKISRNLLFINIMGTNEQENQKIAENNLICSKHMMIANIISHFSASFIVFLGIILLVAVVYFSQYFWKTEPIVLVSFLYLLVRFIQNIGTLVNLYGSINVNLNHFLMTYDYFNLIPTGAKQLALKDINFFNYRKKINKDTKLIDNMNITKKINPSPNIIFDKITFEYQQKNIEIFKDFSLRILPGEQFGIVGKSGTGKTTLLMLLLGIYKPNKGSVLLENKLPEVFFKEKENRVSYVGAESYLIRGTIYENLTYGIKNEVTELEIWDKLKQVSLYEYIKKVGLNYVISDGQGSLSAGQKQRLCIARALLNNPNLLVLDEATANLDDNTEIEVAETISFLKGKCTTIIVSHRKGLLKYADNIFYLSNEG
ncbi:ATP-binding cassette domain-containing protein [Pigmentibacter ruber]